MSGFDPKTNVAKDLADLKSKFGYDYIELDITFRMDLYPFYPPLVKVVRPRFIGFMMGRVSIFFQPDLRPYKIELPQNSNGIIYYKSY